MAGRADGRMAGGRAAPGRRPPARGQRPLAWPLLRAASHQLPAAGCRRLGCPRAAGRQPPPPAADGHLSTGRWSPAVVRRRVGLTFAITCSQPRRSGPKRLGSGPCGVALTTPSPPSWAPCCCSSPPAGEVSFHSRRVGTVRLMPGVHACLTLLLGACGHACSVVSEVLAAKSAAAVAPRVAAAAAAPAAAATAAVDHPFL